MKDSSMLNRIILATTVLAGLAFSAEAQVANISTTAASSWPSFNLTTGMQNASPTTYFSNDGDTMLVLRGGGTATTATIITQATSLYQAGYGSAPLVSQTVSIPSATYVLVGPFPPGRWNTAYGTVGVSMSSVTGVSATAYSQSQ